MDGTTNGKTTAAAVPSSTNTNPTKEIKDTTLAQQEHDFFNQVPNEKEKAKMTKDSILALYGAAPTMNTIPASNQFMPGMPTMNVDNGSLFGMPMQYPQQPVFGMPAANANAKTTGGGMNNFAQFGMMSQGPQMNFQPSNTINSMPNQSMGFSNIPPFNQSNTTKNNAFPAANHTSTANNVNQQFGNLNLGNVWQ